jgi:hypothetical protein
VIFPVSASQVARILGLGLVKEISKQNIEGVAQVSLSTYSKMCEERDKLKKELLIKNKLELEDLENF